MGSMPLNEAEHDYTSTKERQVQSSKEQIIPPKTQRVAGESIWIVFVRPEKVQGHLTLTTFTTIMIVSWMLMLEILRIFIFKIIGLIRTTIKQTFLRMLPIRS